MQEMKTRERIIALVNKEVVPAIGCTEPMAVALCTAKAATLLGKRPDSIEVLLSPNMLKNAMGVGIPGTGMIGLPIAVALGALIGKPEYELEVLKDLTPEALQQGKRYIEDADIDIKLKQGIVEKLYIEVVCHSGKDQAAAIIAGSHTHFVFAERNDEVVLDERQLGGADEDDTDIQLSMRMVYDFAMTAPLDEISFILKTKEYNMRAAELSIKGNYGHCLGKTMDRPMSHGIFGNSIFSHIISRTASACDARMGGAMIPVMSNSGSGNQGITASVPVVVYAHALAAGEEKMLRAVLLSDLVTIYLKQGIGKLSAYCGAISAGCGAGAAIAFLYDCTDDQIEHAVENALAINSGIICDGAKSSCAAKIAMAVEGGLMGVDMSVAERNFAGGDGIVQNTADETIAAVGKIASQGMVETDKEIIDVMLGL